MKKRIVWEFQIDNKSDFTDYDDTANLIIEEGYKEFIRGGCTSVKFEIGETINAGEEEKYFLEIDFTSNHERDLRPGKNNTRAVRRTDLTKIGLL